MLSLRKLMNNTPSDVIERSKQVTAAITSVKKVKRRDLETLQMIVSCKAITEKYRYDVIIELFPTEIHKDVFETPSAEHPSWVKCSCPYFKFYVEYALAMAGSSEIDYSNGKPPHIKNPGKPPIPYLCKHLDKASPMAIAQMFQLAKQARDVKFQKK
jgi:hypothetical protein